MANQLGWVQISKALGARGAGARRSGWSDDERPARGSRRDPGIAGEVLRRVFRPGRTLMLIALVAVTIVSWAVKAGATPQPARLAPSASTATGGSPGLIAAGGGHTCVVLAGGTVSCWGDNTSGQLGAVTSETFSVAPVTVDGLADVIGVSAGGSHSCAAGEPVDQVLVPNELVAKVGVDGKVCLFTDAATHLLADVVGYLP